MSYTRERDQFIASVTREGMSLHAAHALLRQATTINRLSELACSSEEADRDRVPCPAMPRRRNDGTTYTKPDAPCLCDGQTTTVYPPGGGIGEEVYQHERIPRIRLQDWQAEQRAIKAVPEGWRVITSGDPRGYTLRVVPPSYAARNAGRHVHNLDSIGVPPRESGLRF